MMSHSAGTDLTVLGLVNNDGNMTVGLTLDSRDEITTQISSDHISDNYHQCFSLQGLNDTTVHNVTIKLHDVADSQSFNFRGFTYTPNFNSVADMPTLTDPNAIKSASHPSASASASSGTSPSNSGSTSAAPSAANTKTVAGGTIVGAVIGALAGVAIIAGFVFWLLRRRKREDMQRDTPQTAQGSGSR
jgi:hypothetical protein